MRRFYKWSYIGFGEEIGIMEVIICTLVWPTFATVTAGEQLVFTLWRLVANRRELTNFANNLDTDEVPHNVGLHLRCKITDTQIV